MKVKFGFTRSNQGDRADISLSSEHDNLNQYWLNHTKQYRLLKELFGTITMQPQENPTTVLDRLHGNSIQWFLLNNLYYLE